MFDLTTKTGLSQSVDHSACLSVPIKLSSDASFCERQSNVFSALDNLEVVHTRVTEETEAERMAVSRAAWRHTVTAPEDLVEQKRRRVPKSTELSSSPIIDQCKSEFKRPTVLPPTARHRTKNRRDPTKWTHYSLADVDEDAGVGGRSPLADSNGAIAFALMRELKERQLGNEQEISQSSDPKQPHRILFRPLTRTKRPRLETTKTEQPSQHLQLNFYDQEDQSNMNLDQNSMTNSKPEFRGRRARGQFRTSTIESDFLTESNDDDDEECDSTQTSNHENCDEDRVDDDLDRFDEDDGCEVDGMDFLQ